MKTAKIVDRTIIYGLQCPCGGEVANDNTGSLNFFSNESNGKTGTCTACGETVKLPRKVADLQ